MLTKVGLNTYEKYCYNNVQYFSPKSQGFTLITSGCLNRLCSPTPQPTECRTADKLLTYGVVNVKQIILRQWICYVYSQLEN